MPAPHAISCPTCGETYWLARERQIVVRDLIAETDQQSEGMVFVEVRDEQELPGEREVEQAWACANGHPADGSTAARLEILRA